MSGGRPDFDDADLTDEWVARYRIPIVRTPYPHWRYEVALVISRREEGLWPAVRPTELEAAMIGSYIEFRQAYYVERWQRIHRERVLDVDSGTNGVILAKHPDRGWLYRRDSWSRGPTFWPYDQHTPQLSLVEAIDHANKDNRRWGEWKAAHPDVFGAPKEASVS